MSVPLHTWKVSIIQIARSLFDQIHASVSVIHICLLFHTEKNINSLYSVERSELEYKCIYIRLLVCTYPYGTQRVRHSHESVPRFLHGIYQAALQQNVIEVWASLVPPTHPTSGADEENGNVSGHGPLMSSRRAISAWRVLGGENGKFSCLCSRIIGVYYTIEFHIFIRNIILRL